MKLNNKYSLFYLVVVILVITGCNSPVENRSTQIPPLQESEPVFDFDQDIRARGKVVVLNQWDLSFSISGHVIELFFEEGDFIHEGDLIAKLDTTSLIAQVEQADGELAFAQAKLAREMAGPHEAEIAEAEIAVTAIVAQATARATTQVSDLTAFHFSDLAAARAHLNLLLAQPFPEDVAIAQAEVEQALLMAESSRERLKLASMFAPADGTVTKVYVNVHEYANAGQPILEMSNLTELVVEVEMDDLEVASIDIGDTFFVTFEALPGLEVEGRVRSIMPNEARVGERSFIVLIKMDVIPEGLRWGMSAEVVVPRQ